MRYFKMKLKKDTADSALIIFVVTIPVLLLILGFMTQVTKSINVKNAYNAAAQQSAHKSIMTVDVNGALNNSSVQAFIDEYRIQTGREQPTGLLTGLNHEQTQEISSYHSDGCAFAEVDGVERQMPYMVITLRAGRSQNNIFDNASTNQWTIQGTQDAFPQIINPLLRYHSLSADVYDTSQNFFSWFGLPDCQVHRSSVSSLTFASQSDVTW